MKRAEQDTIQWSSDQRRGRERLLAEDTVVAAALGIGSAIGVFLMGGLGTDTVVTVVDYLLVVALFLPLARRSALPLTAAVTVAVAAALAWWLVSYDWHTALAGAVAIYGLGRRVERPASVRWFALLLLGLTAASIVQIPLERDHAGWFSVVARSGLVLAAFWFGDSQQSRDQLLDSFRERAERAEEHRRLVEQQAVLAERNRIARELHDVVAHSLSVMVVQATAAHRLVDHDPASSAAAMGHVADVGRTAMAEMRGVLGLLDGGERSRSPQPRLTDLEPLVRRYRQAGMDVALDLSAPLPELASATELAVVRIVQEALTNVLKHSPTSVVEVRLEVGDEVVLTIEDDGRGDGHASPTTPTAGSGGRGLIGMRERAEALGGTFSAGRSPAGGFTVLVTLPAVSAAMPDHVPPATGSGASA